MVRIVPYNVVAIIITRYCGTIMLISNNNKNNPNPINLPPSTQISQPPTTKTTNHQKREREIGEIEAAMTMAMIGAASLMPLVPSTTMTMAMA